MRRTEKETQYLPGSGMATTLRETTAKVTRVEVNQALLRKAKLDAQKADSSERPSLNAESSKTNS